MTLTNQPHPESTTRWFREPGLGQFRGEGEWRAYGGSDWHRLVETGFLPTFVGEAPPALSLAQGEKP